MSSAAQVWNEVLVDKEPIVVAEENLGSSRVVGSGFVVGINCKFVKYDVKL